MEKLHFFFDCSAASMAKNSAIFPPSSFTLKSLLAILTAFDTPPYIPVAMLEVDCYPNGLAFTFPTVFFSSTLGSFVLAMNYP
jgi:hypothetical protein